MFVSSPMLSFLSEFYFRFILLLSFQGELFHISFLETKKWQKFPNDNRKYQKIGLTKLKSLYSTNKTKITSLNVQFPVGEN